ncbi:penicillin acylase family protein [Simiduia agarivorans]|uniref:Penicillin amidase n=1 Tax=Simiduia agarivorans (strain DSM 21679 / JCM 13881 / BCRC 17597 / SA1) TaxID=1117647 RepID=K4L466_SIMAS|nr:penicillin acylase family protein [Simiduia agarivorans]AFV01008.1 penicillin amidase [Simiduia agarivorans SA1 = DSM 21679]
MMGKILFRSLVGLLAIALIAAAIVYLMLRQSLPVLDGSLQVDALNAAVSIERDQQGLVEIVGTTRPDIAFGLGFAHAQDRFFQMDLQRRNAAGELSALFGEAALKHDKQVRAHQFRQRASATIAQFSAGQKLILSAYTEGVNAGLAALGRAPFEYTLLNHSPTPWRDEDSMLTVFSMILVLQDDQALFERSRGTLAQHLPADLYAFFTQQGGQWDAPLVADDEGNTQLASAPLPEHGWADLSDPGRMVYRPQVSEDMVVGSNNWAVAGAVSKHGGAIVADDMHLAVRVPNIWYRAQWRLPDDQRLISGATLPGTPLLVAGSNSHLAWGFTNTQGDWSDVIVLQTNDDESQYLTADGWRDFDIEQEHILVKGQATEIFEVKRTHWGPVIGRDDDNRMLAMIWTAHFHQGANMNALALETANTVEAAVALAPQIGIPHQNLALADKDGNIAWTIAGPFPNRQGTDGKLPEDWSQTGASWDGFRTAEEHPSVVKPLNHRLWTANARTLSGDAFERMGDSAYALGARQQQIRDRLLAGDNFDEADMLALQLDDEARFLKPWRDHLLKTLAAEENLTPALQAMQIELSNWQGFAAIESVSYRLVRESRLKIMELAIAPLETYMMSKDPAFNYSNANRQTEYPLWQMLSLRPAHLLNKDFNSWHELELFAMKQVVEPLFADGTLTNDTWGEANRVIIQHPMARFVAPIHWWLSMPNEPLRGDTHMPRVQTPTHGASERFAVSPGKEDQAYFHMATGQSAHPLSAFFGKGHQDWVEGNASPWLKGPTKHRLTLVPN